MTKKKRLPVLNSIDLMAAVLDILGNPTRLRIVLALESKGPMTVSALTALVGESQPVVSNHLARMKSKGVLTDRRQGVFRYYSVTNTKWLRSIRQFIDEN